MIRDFRRRDQRRQQQSARLSYPNDNFKAMNQTRFNELASLLENLLLGKLEYNITFTRLSDGYFLIDEIILLPEFKAFNCTHEDIVYIVHTDSLLRFSIRGSKVRLKPKALNKDPDVRLSKLMAWVLRHGASTVGMQYDAGGYLYLDDVLRLDQFRNYTVADIQRIVDSNDKKRFELSKHPNTGRLRLRAYQGHSVKIDGLDLVLITNPKDFPNVVHGTYYANWYNICKEGLSKMYRTHIHFARGLPDDDRVISGMRSSSEVIIFLDLEKAMSDGIKFYLSTNEVILTEGNSEGFVLPIYFKRVIDKHGKELLNSSK